MRPDNLFFVMRWLTFWSSLVCHFSSVGEGERKRWRERGREKQSRKGDLGQGESEVLPKQSK